MKTSKASFVKYLESRLIPESAKSYQAYVEAFARSVDKDNEYYFSSTERKDELIELLNGGLEKHDKFSSHSKKYQANIKTGVRALIKYYNNVSYEPKEQEIKRAKVDTSMTLDQMMDHYLGRFGNWLQHGHIKKDGSNFESFQNYLVYMRNAITDMGTSPSKFFSYARTFDIFIFQKKLNSKKNFLSRSKSYRRNINSSINKYKLYIAELHGEKTTGLFKVVNRKGTTK